MRFLSLSAHHAAVKIGSFFRGARFILALLSLLAIVQTW